MRTTLDIDDSLLAIAKARASERGVSLGAAVSELIRAGVAVPVGVGSSGFPIFYPPAGAPVVTDQIVARFRDDPAGNEPDGDSGR